MKSKYEVRNKTLSLQELSIYSTKGEGDCAFHAILGSWNGTEFICNYVQSVRLRIAQAIRKFSINLDSEFNSAIKKCLEQCIMESNDKQFLFKANSQIAKAKRSYVTWEKGTFDELKVIKKDFSNELSNHTDILSLLKASKQGRNSSVGLADIFFNFKANADKSALEKLECFLEEKIKLKRLYKKFITHAEIKFDISNLLNQNLINEYADLMTQSAENSDKAYWLYAAELKIVALVFNIRVELFVGHDEKPVIYNETAKKIKQVYFDGTSHYEKVDTQHKYLPNNPIPGDEFKSFIQQQCLDGDDFADIPTDDSFNIIKKLSHLGLNVNKSYLVDIQQSNEYVRKNVCTQNIEQHIDKIFELEAQKYTIPKADSITAKICEEFNNIDYLLDIKIQHMLGDTYELLVTLFSHKEAHTLLSIVCTRDEVIHDISLPMFKGASIVLDANLCITVKNLRAKNPVKISSIGSITVVQCSDLAALYCSANQDITIKDSLQVNSHVVLVSPHGACNIDSDIEAAGTIAITAKDIAIIDPPDGVQRVMHAGQNIYLHGIDSLKHGLTKIESCGETQIYAPRAIEYKLANINANQNICIVLNSALDLQLNIDKNLDYHVLSTEQVVLNLIVSMVFSNTLKIFAPYCDVVIGNSELKVDFEAKHLQLYLNSLCVRHGGVFGKQNLSLILKAYLRGGELTNNRTMPYGEYLKNKQAYLGSDRLLVLQAKNNIVFADCMVQCLMGNSIIRTSNFHMTTGKLLVGKDCTLDAITAKIDIIYCNPPTGESTKYEIPTQSGVKCSVRWVHAAQQILTPPSEVYIYGTLTARPGLQIMSIGSELHYGAFSGDTLPSSIDVQQYLILSGANFFRKHWYNYDSPLPASHAITARGVVESIADVHLNSCNAAVISRGRLMSKGRIVSYTGDLTIGDRLFKVAINAPVFSTSAHLFGDSRSFGMYKEATFGASVYLIPAVSISRLLLPKYPPVVLLNSNRIMVDTAQMYSKYRDDTDEVSFLFPQITKRLFSSVLTGIDTDPIVAWNFLQINAQQWITKHPNYIQHITQEEMNAALLPMLYYVPETHIWHGKAVDTLQVQLYLPKSLYAKLNKCYNEGWFANEIEVHARNVLVCSSLDADDQVNILASGEMATVRPRNYVTRTVTVRSSSRSLTGSKSKTYSKEVTDVYINHDMGCVRAGNVTINAQSAELEGDLESRNGDTIIHTNNDINLNPGISTKYVHNEVSARRGLTKKHVSEHNATHTINPATVSSKGVTIFTTDNGNIVDGGALFFSTAEKFAALNGNITSNPTIIKQQLPTTLGKCGAKITMQSGSQEICTPSLHVATGNIEHKAGNKINHNGASFVAKEVHMASKNGVKIGCTVLNAIMLSSVTGFANAFTYVDSKTKTILQAAIQPTISGFKILTIESETQDVELESVKISGLENSKLELTAKEGSVQVTTAKLDRQSTTTTHKVGISFTGSETIAAALEGNFKQALKSLASMSPLLAPIVNMAQHGNHTEDFMANSMLLACRMYDVIQENKLNYEGLKENALEPFGFKTNADGVSKFDFKNLNIALNLSETTTEEQSTEVLISVINACDIIFKAARDVDLHSVHINGDILKVNAGGNIALFSDAEHAERHETTNGVSLGYNGAPTVGANAALGKDSKTKYKTTAYKLKDKVSLSSGNNVDVRGTLLQTARAFIECKRLLVETLLDTEKKRSAAASISSSGCFSSSASKFDSAWAEQQSGIEASDTLYINAKDEVSLKAGVLRVDDSTPLTDAEGLVKLYQIQMPADGEDLFHALGVSRLKAASDLLKNVDRQDIRNMVANDIARMLKACQLPKIMANQPHVLELLAAYKRDANNKKINKKILKYCKTKEAYQDFVASYVGMEGSNLSFDISNPNARCTIDAIAKLNKLSLKAWVVDDDKQLQLKHDLFVNNHCRQVDLTMQFVDDNVMRFNLLSNDPMLLITPVITHEHLRGYKRGSGFGMLGSAGDESSRSMGMGTMFRSNQHQELNASILGKVCAIKPQGGAHDIEGSDINTNVADVKVDGKKHRIGVGGGGTGTMPVVMLEAVQFKNAMEARVKAEAELRAKNLASDSQAPQTSQDGINAVTNEIGATDVAPDRFSDTSFLLARSNRDGNILIDDLQTIRTTQVRAKQSSTIDIKKSSKQELLNERRRLVEALRAVNSGKLLVKDYKFINLDNKKEVKELQSKINSLKLVYEKDSKFYHNEVQKLEQQTGLFLSTAASIAKDDLEETIGAKVFAKQKEIQYYEKLIQSSITQDLSKQLSNVEGQLGKLAVDAERAYRESTGRQSRVTNTVEDSWLLLGSSARAIKTSASVFMDRHPDLIVTGGVALAMTGVGTITSLSALGVAAANTAIYVALSVDSVERAIKGTTAIALEKMGCDTYSAESIANFGAEGLKVGASVLGPKIPKYTQQLYYRTAMGRAKGQATYAISNALNNGGISIAMAPATLRASVLVDGYAANSIVSPNIQWYSAEKSLLFKLAQGYKANLAKNIGPNYNGHICQKQTGNGFYSGAADDAYNAIRTSKHDVSNIAKNTGLKENSIQKIKDHLFYDKHLLDRYVEYGLPAEMKVFDSDIAIANAWKRLELGGYNKYDIQLLKHEAAEAWYMRNHGSSYTNAHNAADKRYPAPDLETMANDLGNRFTNKRE